MHHQHSQNTTLAFLETQKRGKKVLVLDPHVSGFLGIFAEVALLREHGVEQCALTMQISWAMLSIPNCTGCFIWARNRSLTLPPRRWCTWWATGLMLHSRLQGTYAPPHGAHWHINFCTVHIFSSTWHGVVAPKHRLDSFVPVRFSPSTLYLCISPLH